MNARLKNAVAAELSTRKPAGRKPAGEISVVANRLVTADGVLVAEVRLAAILFAPADIARNRQRPFAPEELKAPSRVAEFSSQTKGMNHVGVFAGENFETRTYPGNVTIGTLVRTYVETLSAYWEVDPTDTHATPPGTKVAVSWIGEVLDVKA